VQSGPIHQPSAHDTDRVVASARRRVAAAFAAVAVGMSVAAALPTFTPAFFFIAACGLAAIAIAFTGWPCRLALLTCAGAAAAGWFAFRVHTTHPTDLAPMIDRAAAEMNAGARRGSDPLITVRGVVLETPRTSTLRGSFAPFARFRPRERFTFHVTQVLEGTTWRAALGTLWIFANESEVVAIRAGDRLVLTATASPLPAPLNPGEPDLRRWARANGYAGSASLVGSDLDLTPPSITTRARTTIMALRDSLRSRARAVLDAAAAKLSHNERDLLHGLVLGDENTADSNIRDAFNRVGLAHVLSISGFHLVVMAGLALFLVRLTGDRGRLEPIIVAALVLGYMLIVPAQAPVVRSGLLVLALLASEALGRRYDRVAVLGFVSIALLLWRPLDLFSLGYQLSCGLTALLLWQGASFTDRLFGSPLRTGMEPVEPPLSHFIVNAPKTLIATSLMCWAVGVPLVMLHVGVISPLGVLASIIVIPLITILLWGAYIALFAGMLFGPAAGVVSFALAPIVGWCVDLVSWIDTLPFSHAATWPVSTAWALAATLALILVVYLYRRSPRPRHWWLGYAAAGCCALWLAGERFLATRAWGASSDLLRNSPRLRIDMLAVGDGTCMLLRSGSGNADDAILWDCGSMRPGIGERLIPRAVHALGSWRVHTIIITHPDIDHFSGVLDAALPLGVQRVLLGARFFSQAEQEPHGPAAFLLRSLRDQDIEISSLKSGDTLTFGDARIDFISPPLSAEITDGWPTDNDHSFVATVSLADQPPALLLTGDIGVSAIAALRRSRPALRAGVLELPHHGSFNTLSEELVFAVAPSIVLQSTGPSRVGDTRWDVARRNRAWHTSAVSGSAFAEIHADGRIITGAFQDPDN
jgi:competence protein ComEC